MYKNIRTRGNGMPNADVTAPDSWLP